MENKTTITWPRWMEHLAERVEMEQQEQQEQQENQEHLAEMEHHGRDQGDHETGL
jgi:hypothetical protein